MQEKSFDRVTFSACETYIVASLPLLVRRVRVYRTLKLYSEL